MGTGYTRNDTANNIADGNIINASDLDGEFDAVQSAFDASTGHTHDGTAGEGAPIETIGPSQDVVATASVLRPKTDNTVDLGTTSLEYKDLFLDGTAHIDTLDVDENASITGTLGVTGTTTLGTANITTGTITTADINGGNIDGTIIGATTAAAITGTTITGTSFVTSGDMTFGDNDKAIFGAGSDLQIYHDGSNSYIKEDGAGSLFIQSNGAGLIVEKTDGENLAYFDTGNSKVRLYQGGIEKLATTATGVDITGTLTSDGLTVGDGHTIGDDGFDNLVIESSSGENIRLVSNHATLPLDITSDVGLLVQTVFGTDRLFVDNSTGDISFFEDTGTTAKFFWDASAESLGIGTSGNSPWGTTLSSLRLGSSGSVAAHASSDATYLNSNAYYTDAWRYVTNDAASNIELNGNSGDIRFNIAPTGTVGASFSWSEAMRIDSSGNLLVGQTSINYNAIGGSISAGGTLRACADSFHAASFNRKTLDGDIAIFYKDGATVGSIGVNTDRVYLATTSKGVCIDQSAARMIPTDASGNTNDANMDLGQSNGRWKNLYLSGGVVLDDNPTAVGGDVTSKTLDDYEEGTFSVEIADAASGGNVSAGTGSGHYTKIGNICYYTISEFNLDTTGLTGTNALYFRSFPFVEGKSIQHQATVWYDSANLSASSNGLVFVKSAGNSVGLLYELYDNASETTLKVNQINDDQTDFYITGFYMTS